MSTKLPTVVTELQNLDQEILDINQRLVEGPEAFMHQSMSLSIGSGSSTQDESGEFLDDLPMRSPVHIDNDRPPAERLLESQQRRLKRVNELPSEADKQFQHDHPFAPVLETPLLGVAYAPNHLEMRMKKSRVKPAGEPAPLVSRPFASSVTQEAVMREISALLRDRWLFA
jgi:hypothetical protein